MKKLTSNNFNIGILLYFIGIIFFFSGIYFIGSHLFNRQPVSSKQLPRQNKTIEQNNNRLLILLIDSAQREYLFSDLMPYLDSLRQKSAWGTSKVVSTPFSSSGDAALFGGVMLSPLSIMSDFSGKTVKFSNLFQRAKKAGKKVLITGNEGCLSGMFGEWSISNSDKIDSTLQHSTYEVYEKTAQLAYNKALKDLQNKDWDIAAVQLLALDYVGHLETPQSPEYSKMCSRIDKQIKEIIKLTSKSDYILITSEHGMDDSGFHTKLTDKVSNTGFIFQGPKIQKGEFHSLYQIDWAPTLSIVAGLSPYYKSYAIPALDLLKIEPTRQEKLLNNFSQVISPNKDISNIKELRELRNNKINPTSSIMTFVLVVLCGLLSVFSLILAYYYGQSPTFKKTSHLKRSLLMLTMIVLPGIILSYSNIFSLINNKLIFSANFIINNFIPIILTISVLSIPAFWTKNQDQLLQKVGHSNITFPGLIVLLSWLILMPNNPYSILCWFLLIFSYLLGLYLRRLDFFIFSILMVIGLLIRRLTYIKSILAFPSRKIILSTIFVLYCISLIILHYKNKSKFPYWRISIIALLTVGTFLTHTVEARFLLMISGFIPLFFFFSFDDIHTRIALGVWSGFFLLGTSGNINNATHLIIIPLFILILLYTSDNHFYVLSGLIFMMTVWLLYILPGNSFTLKFSDLYDSFILSTARTNQIIISVLIIASRYILPLVIVLTGIKKISHKSIIPILSLASIPAILAALYKSVVLSIRSEIPSPLTVFTPIIIITLIIFIMMVASILSYLFSGIKSRIHRFR